MSYARIRQLKGQSLSIDQGSLGGRTKMSDPLRTDIATIDAKDKQATGLDYGELNIRGTKGRSVEREIRFSCQCMMLGSLLIDHISTALGSWLASLLQES